MCQGPPYLFGKGSRWSHEINSSLAQVPIGGLSRIGFHPKKTFAATNFTQDFASRSNGDSRCSLVTCSDVGADNEPLIVDCTTDELAQPHGVFAGQSNGVIQVQEDPCA